MEKITLSSESKVYKFQKNQFGMNLLIVETDKEVKQIEKLLNQNKWWLKK